MPLFALRSHRDWGIGELGDLGALAGWAAGAGHGLLQLLPVFEMPAGERCPYAGLSAFALDPIYLSLAEVEDFVAAGGEQALAAADRDALAAARSAAGIDYVTVRTVKAHALALAFARFVATEWRARSARAEALRRFVAAERGWLDDYALFRASQDARAGASWTTWEVGLRTREPSALAAARLDAADAILFHQYVQWLLAEQWAAARRAATAVGVRLKGDLPFSLAPSGVDVWARPEAFDPDATLGAPPDDFSAEGQRWGLAVCRWDAAATWLAARAARAADLFDAVRLDHVVGFFRQYVIPHDAAPHFVPAHPASQRGLGVRLLGDVRRAAGSLQLIGEDLGVIPRFVRDALARLGVDGYRVLRWERRAGRIRNPVRYPARSVATSGTHDTSALAEWWERELDDAGRRALAAVPAFAALRVTGAAWTPVVHAALLDGLYAAGSALVVLPIIDAYGGRERINVPATVTATNWSYRLPWRVDELTGAGGRALRDRLRALAARHGRTRDDA